MIAEIERLEREAQRIRDLAKSPAPDAEQRVLDRRAEEIKEQIGCLLPNLS